MGAGAREITQLLHAAAEGDREAAGELLPLVYQDLKGLARMKLRQLRHGKTLSTTDLVHEAWLRLVAHGDPGWEGRRHFYGAAARAMRNILVEQTRRKRALKREEARLVALEEDLPALSPGPTEDALAVGEALERLERDFARPAEVTWLRFFCGLSMEEVSEVLRISLTSAERDWRFARAWLQNALSEKEG